MHCHQIRQHRLFHAAANGTADKLRKQHRTVCGGEELLHAVTVGTADVNVKTLQLTLIRVQSGKGCFGIRTRRVHALQYL